MCNPNRPLTEYFEDLTDPRVDRTKLHSLKNIVFITITGVLCGAESWVEIEDFMEMKTGWLSKYLDLPNGIPSHDTFENVFARIDPDEFEHCFLRWVNDLAEVSQGEIIAIDGKTVRGSYDKGTSKVAIHMVSAWSSANQMVIVQRCTDLKSNEITAIPRLLELLSLNGSIVAIDAMGCQKEIAAKITEKWAEEAEKWLGLKSVAKIERTRYLKPEGPTTTQVAYYICSLKTGAKVVNQAARAHSEIENSLHWCLDVIFDEDRSRIRKGHAAQNFSLIRKIVLNMLRKKTLPTTKRPAYASNLKGAHGAMSTGRSSWN